MGVTAMTIELTVEYATCAVCDQPVKTVVGTPSRQMVSAASTAYAATAWCMLEPCGHAFTVRRGGLIY